MWFDIVKIDPLEDVGKQLLEYAEEVYMFWTKFLRRVKNYPDKQEKPIAGIEGYVQILEELVRESDERVRDIYAIVQSEDYKEKPAALLFQLREVDWKETQKQIDEIPLSVKQNIELQLPQIPDIQEMQRQIELFVK